MTSVAMEKIALNSTVLGPFGPSTVVDSLPVAVIADMYRRKCGLDVSPDFGVLREIHLYECALTGLRFWRPIEIAGAEDFYRRISAHWPNYYRAERWEYGLAREASVGARSLLEVGCGRGYFLRQVESKVIEGQGIELNTDAIKNKVTKWPISAQQLANFAAENPGKFDFVCSFQVLEHVADPHLFLKYCLRCLKPGGKLCVSVPSYENVEHQLKSDAFDLPPHHINHFTRDTVLRISAHLGLTLEQDAVEPRRPVIPAATARTQSAFSYRVLARIARDALRVAYRLTREPGHTAVYILKKPG